MTLRPSRFAGLARWAAAFPALLLAACGTVTFDDGRTDGPDPDRRLYVNDVAANDSLPRDLLLKGLKFVLQPGKSYQISVATKRQGDELGVYFANGGTYKTLKSTSDGSRQLFSVVSDRPTAQFFLGQFLAEDGLAALPALGHVTLNSQDLTPGDSLHVRLIFVRTLRGLPNEDAKKIFSQQFFVEMTKVYSSKGVTILGSYEIVEPTLKPMGFPFSAVYTALPGKRVANHAHLYLVDSIVAGSDLDPKGEVLGFAPREALDLDSHGDSRVVLSRKAGSVIDLATTACHELGHFFGLRHTTATAVDLSFDLDYSNLDDGFATTPACPDLEKAALRESSPYASYQEGKYCIRLQPVSCPTTCDIGNLMFPYDCNDSRNPQRELTAEQVSFLKRGLNLYRR